MSKNRPHAVTTAIIGHNVPVNREPYDPKETILDMPAAYQLAKSVLDDPKSGIPQKLKASQFMTMLEIKAREMGVNLNQKGRVQKVSRSELKRDFKTSTMGVNPLDVALLYKNH